MFPTLARKSPFGEVLAALLLALVAALAAEWLHLPLPWMIGPLFSVAAARTAGLPLLALPGGRQAGQWAIGTALGLYFTPEVLGHLGDNLLPVLSMAGCAVAVAGHEAFSGSARVLDPARLPVLVGAALAGVLLLRRLRIANAWVLGPLFCIGVLAALEVPLSALPGWAVSGGQLLLGTALGCRFSPAFFRAAPRFLAVSAVSTLLALLLSAAFVMLLGQVVSIPVSSLALAASPGGMAEMCVTAKVMHLAVPLITATHVLRVVLLTVWAPRMCGVFLRVFGR